jgi:hypothetical protein
MVAFKNRTRRWQQQTPVRGAYASVGWLQWVLQSLPLPKKRYRACIFSEIEVSKCPSRVKMYNSESMEGLSVRTAAGDGNCQVLPLNFQR